MKLSQAAASVLFSSAALAAPAKTVQERSTTTCSSFNSITTGAYTIYQNLWGASAASSGSQCQTFNSLSNGYVSWSTSWSWEGGSSNVKSYDNVAVTSTGVKLSEISSIDSKFEWSYTGNNVVADVSFDLFTAASASGAAEYEIMIWLAALGGAGPISSTGSPIATPKIDSTTWKLYKGPNGDTTVFSFVAESEVTNFDDDIFKLVTYLIDNEGLSSSQYLTTLEAGTEPFTGSDAVFTVSAYSAVINK